jgi:hypothetical protein
MSLEALVLAVMVPLLVSVFVWVEHRYDTGRQSRIASQPAAASSSASFQGNLGDVQKSQAKSQLNELPKVFYGGSANADVQILEIIDTAASAEAIKKLSAANELEVEALVASKLALDQQALSNEKNSGQKQSPKAVTKVRSTTDEAVVLRAGKLKSDPKASQLSETKKRATKNMAGAA